MSNKKLSLLFSGFYVGLGTLYSCLYWTGYSILIPTGTFLYYLIAPVSFFPILIIFSEAEPFLYILIFQLITFFIIWLIFFIIFSSLSKIRQQFRKSRDDLDLK
jgi:hypothetical protein